MTYHPTAYESALWAWLDAVVGRDVTEVRFAQQDEPRPDLPFVTLRVISEVATQTPEVKITHVPMAGGYTVEVHEHRTATVSVNVFGANHRELIARIERSLWDPYITALNTTAGVEVQAAMSAAQDLTELIATEYEGRSQQDYRASFSTTTESPFPGRSITTVDDTGTINDLTVHHTESA